MDRLWAPWRSSYVSAAGPGPQCFLCEMARGEGGPLAVAQDASTVTVINKFPYNTGHLMVAPKAHIPDLIAAGDAVAADLMVAALRAMRVVVNVLEPEGFNLGVNHGAVAGASVDHLHMHVVPRWAGDTNFMPVVGSVKVLPELLEDTARRLREGFARLS